MKRRSMLMLSLLAIPGRLFAQEPASRSRSARGRTISEDDRDPPAKRLTKAAVAEDPEVPDRGPAPSHAESIPANFPEQAGYIWKTFPIADYSALDPNQSNPQTAILDWIFRRTDTAPWHGDKIAVLSASRSQIRAYNSPKVIEQVAEVIDRFTDAYENILSVRVRFAAATDSRWRYVVHQRLTPVGSGPQGQQIWQANPADADMALRQMEAWQGFRLLEDQKHEMVNGLTLLVSHTDKRTFAGGLQRENAAGQGYQPKTDRLEEGIVLRFSPLLTYEGDGLDAAIELSTNAVRKLHATKVLAPGQIGPGEQTIDVPEVSETRLNKPIKNWPLGQALVISAGIQPGILQDKGGLFNMRIPGTVPTGTETIVIINVELAARKRST
ncbi:hypothetical protein TA3x_004371 [Tundrisphaera sp. TA3]|uniref:hypothetical protein n=1 Tax=Tundrisphaera sp. TA3 TaxID=3435775 RepID=UPI003EB93717